MAFVDREINCLDCSQPFTFTAGEQEFYERKGFKEDNPDAAAFLSRMKLPLDELEAAMFDAQETSYEQAVEKYIADHPERVKAWLEGSE